ncbi:MAG TPA: glycoside hydrolase family 3 C-terminal domain-containing protein, partial [Acidimicrobiales bacterium]|nr:glycoside hydrolase family 3 C-terminal domain-containing protein [Acidimicrobiales bacterium]
GVGIDRKVPTLPIALHAEYFAGSDIDAPGERVHQVEQSAAEFFHLGAPPDAPEPFTVRATGTFTPDAGGSYVFSLVQAGRARLSVDGAVVIDGVTDPMPRDRNAYFGFGSDERTAVVDLEAGRAVDVVIEYTSRGAGGVYAARVGARPEVPSDAMDVAIAAARDADAAVVVVGTTDEWESEGFDRTTLQLPGDQDHLIERIAAANPNTVVVVNTGAPVEMSWVDAVPAVLQLWFGGQEMANALADVLTGATEPGGRLPTTIPLRLEHNPSFGNFPGEHDEVRYGEGLLVGYRWYDARHLPVRFPFGHGLSYTSFEIGEPAVSTTHVAPGDVVTVDVPVTNTGARAGSEVVQCYVAPPNGRITRPPKELKAFAKVHLQPGESTTVQLTLTERAFAVWDRGSGQRAELKARLPFADMMAPASGREPGWRVHAGTYVVHVGRSSAELVHSIPVEVDASS